MIRGAIFDADGTLLDSMPMWSGVGSGYLRKFGIEAKEDLDERFRDMSLYQSAQCLKEEYALPFTIEEIAVGINEMVDHLYENSVELKPGVEDILIGLKARGVKMCVATASEAYQVRMALKRNNIEHYFEDVLSCVDVGHGKDEPDIFYTGLNLLGVEKEECLVFEDAIYAVKTAGLEGFATVGIYDDSNTEQDKLIAMTEHYIKDYRNIGAFWQYLDNK